MPCLNRSRFLSRERIRGKSSASVIDYAVAVIDAEAHDGASVVAKQLVMLDATHFALVYVAGSTGELRVFSMDANGGNIAGIQYLQYDAVKGDYPSITKVKDGLLAIAYTGSGSDGYIITVSYHAETYALAVVDSLEHDEVLGYHNSLITIDSTHIGLAYRSTLDDAYVKTFSVDANGDNITQIDAYCYEQNVFGENSLCLLDSTHLVVAWRDSGGDGNIRVVAMDGSYDVSAGGAVFEFEASTAYAISLVKINATTVAVAYSGPDDDGFLKTLKTNPANYSLSLIDTLEFDAVYADYCSLLLIDSTHLAVAYLGTAATGSGELKVFSIDENCDNITQIQSLTHAANATSRGYCAFTKMSDTVLALAHSTDEFVGVVKTISINAV